jgi:hypothetical protein
MNKIERRVAGMFRRGLPSGDQLDLLTAWVTMKLTGEKPVDSKTLLAAIAASIARATVRLSDRL